MTVLITACKITSGTKSVDASILCSNAILQLKLQSLALSSPEIALLLHGTDSLKAFCGEIQLFCRGLTDYEESKGVEVAKEVGSLTGLGEGCCFMDNAGEKRALFAQAEALVEPTD